MRRPLALLLLMTAVAAQDEKPVVPPDPLYECVFEDGSVLIVSLPVSSVTVDTRFGKMTVPLAEVKKIEAGFRYPEGVESKVRGAVDDLGSADFKTREAAQRVLLAAGEYAVPAVRDGTKSSVPEVAERCEAILQKLVAGLSEEQLNRPDVDVITTGEMVLRGRIAGGGFKAKTKLFGDVQVNLADLKGFRPLGGKNEGTFKLDATKYAAPGWKTFYDTGLEVQKDQGVSITASGKIDLRPDSAGQHVSGPNGGGTQVPGPGGVYVKQQGGGPLDGNGTVLMFASGAVYGRIGETGPLFKIGEKWTQAKAATAGRLYLVIAPSGFGTVSKGEYEVKVKLGK